MNSGLYTKGRFVQLLYSKQMFSVRVKLSKTSLNAQRSSATLRHDLADSYHQFSSTDMCVKCSKGPQSPFCFFCHQNLLSCTILVYIIFILVNPNRMLVFKTKSKFSCVFSAHSREVLSDSSSIEYCFRRAKGFDGTSQGGIHRR